MGSGPCLGSGRRPRTAWVHRRLRIARCCLGGIGEPQAPPRLCRTDMGGRPEDTRLVLGPKCPRGPCWAALPNPLPLWTQGCSLGSPLTLCHPRRWLEGPASQCSLCAGKAVLAGGGEGRGVGSRPYRAFVSSPKGMACPSSSPSCPQQGPCCLPQSPSSGCLPNIPTPEESRV